MNLKKTLLLITACTLIFAACKKDKDAPPPVNLSNTNWSDIATISGVTYNPFKVVFNADGSATIAFAGFTPFNGTWNKPVNSNKVYFYFEVSGGDEWKGEGNLTEDNMKIENGVLTRLSSSPMSGTFSLKKQ